MMKFNRALTTELRKQFPADYRTQLFYCVVPRKESVELSLFFIARGIELRSDAEVGLSISDKEFSDWGEEEAALTVFAVKEFMYRDLESEDFWESLDK